VAVGDELAGDRPTDRAGPRDGNSHLSLLPGRR
jgi:hypothetical protein